MNADEALASVRRNIDVCESCIRSLKPNEIESFVDDLNWAVKELDTLYFRVEQREEELAKAGK